ncbi:molybdenum cofactor sulfurase protein-like protein [Myriangium duriaei CBS 260.36]|uniref:Molybdenum cofactor sulfurase n=1 Tax=Myriangium duriaei CBS 260.36 TaxID=1168546 RepID=A0A9P4J8C2_9PEZI|nr:molybdenum cofactor sulfurase protein-like protein [Myriangium duriaei CBS 260.36]
MQVQAELDYDAHIEEMRKEQYPMLEDALYLDHAGTTPTAKLLMDNFHSEMVSNLYGNPHSFSQASHRTAETIEGVRLQLLRFFKADPDHFDVVFTANATAAFKLVGDAFRDIPGGFEYGYHAEAHTSLVGLRELARSKHCFGADKDVEDWLAGQPKSVKCYGETMPMLFAFPAQSNLNGRKLPLDWCSRSRHGARPTYSLLDAAALVATSPLDLSNPETAPDFTAFSLYKIFGFPDLGALIVRRKSEQIFENRRYFGGGTVDLVIGSPSCGKAYGADHIPKASSLHERLEDGTLPYHSILALKSAIHTHEQLFQSLERVARHTMFLAGRLYHGIKSLRHSNGSAAAQVHIKESPGAYLDPEIQGPVIAFNLLSPHGQWISNAEFEKLAFAKNVNVRTGGLCNPGGTAKYLGLTSHDLRSNFDAGYRCGSDMDVINGKPTGMIRASLGAMSTSTDVDRFVDFLNEFYVERSSPDLAMAEDTSPNSASVSTLRVESITVYPIKSCAGWQPVDTKDWPIRAEGLAWDREWCLVHAITGRTLSQKRYSKMALIKPELDLNARVLRVRGTHATTLKSLSIEIALDAPMDTHLMGSSPMKEVDVCGSQCSLMFYNSTAINDFFTECVGLPCRLARFPDPGLTPSTRHAKPHLVDRGMAGLGRAITLSNESPILTITRASLNRLDETIKGNHGKAASPAVFRANIVLANTELTQPGVEQPYAEDEWSAMRIGNADFEFLGGCRRCQMVCIDQSTSERNPEPLATLAKTRRIDGKVMFGVHTALLPPSDGRQVTIRVGDSVQIF